MASNALGSLRPMRAARAGGWRSCVREHFQDADGLKPLGPQPLFAVLRKGPDQGRHTGGQDVHAGIVTGHADRQIRRGKIGRKLPGKAGNLYIAAGDPL